MPFVLLLAVWFAVVSVAVYVAMWAIVGLVAMSVAIVRGLAALSTRSRGYGS